MVSGYGLASKSKGPDKQTHPRDDRDIGHIENRPVRDLKKVHYVTQADSIDEISSCSGEHERYANALNVGGDPTPGDEEADAEHNRDSLCHGEDPKARFLAQERGEQPEGHVPILCVCELKTRNNRMRSVLEIRDSEKLRRLVTADSRKTQENREEQRQAVHAPPRTHELSE